MKYQELTNLQKQAILEQEIEDFRTNPDSIEVLEFLLEFWLEHGNEDFEISEYGISFA